MNLKWYAVLLDKIYQSYSDLVVVKDPDKLGQCPEIQADLEGIYKLHYYRDELSLRAFLQQNQGHKLVVFCSPEAYFPYDVEASAHLVNWQIKDVFPRLEASVSKEHPLEYYSRIYEGYQKIEKSPVRYSVR